MAWVGVRYVVRYACKASSTLGWSIIPGGIMLLKTKVIAKFVHQLVVEFLPIISDDVTGYTIPEDDIPFDKVHNSFFLHFVKYSNFSPFGEIICRS